MGSWMFVGGFLLFMVIWAAANAADVAAKTDIETLLELTRFQMKRIDELHALLRDRITTQQLPTAV